MIAGDAVYIDNEFKTALAYCNDKKCRVKVKKAVLDYDDMRIWSALDWLNNIESAKKTGEELIGQRNSVNLPIPFSLSFSRKTIYFVYQVPRLT